MHVVFRHDRDVVSKNPAGGVDPRRVAAWARRQGVFLLVIFSLHKQRKVTRSPKGSESLCSCSCSCSRSSSSSSSSSSSCSSSNSTAIKVKVKVKGFRPPSAREQTLTSHSAVEELFFACAKKRGPKRCFSTAEWLVKHTLPTRLPRCALQVHSAGRIFRRYIPVSSKNDVHPCTSPRTGSCLPAPSLRKGTGGSRAIEQRQRQRQLQLQLQLPKPKPKPKPKQLHPSHTLPYALRKGEQVPMYVARVSVSAPGKPTSIATE